MKKKKIQAWAVVYKGKILTEGWGSNQSWVFRTKWLAQDEINCQQTIKNEELKIIKIEITYDI